MKILLVDGSYELLTMWEDWLKKWRRELDIDTATSGDAAISLYRRRGPYDLVLTDDIHPGINGTDFVKAIRDLHPTQRIAFLTLEKSTEETVWEQFRIPSLRKPFELRELQKLLHEMLDDRVVFPSLESSHVTHSKDVHLLFLVIAIGILIVGTVLAGMGVFLVYIGSRGDTSISFFGQSFSSSNVGIGAIFIGATTIVVVLTRLLKRLHVLSD